MTPEQAAFEIAIMLREREYQKSLLGLASGARSITAFMVGAQLGLIVLDHVTGCRCPHNVVAIIITGAAWSVACGYVSRARRRVKRRLAALTNAINYLDPSAAAAAVRVTANESARAPRSPR